MDQSSQDSAIKPKKPDINGSLSDPLPKVEIFYSENQKPYLGGFKSIKTGLVYHHAFAQTDQIAHEHPIKYHRDVYLIINL